MGKSPYNTTTELAEFSSLDKQLINLLQRDIPVAERPFLEIAKQLNRSEEEIITHLNTLMARKIFTRFGPMFDAACLGGAFTLAALAVPEERFEEVAKQVNSFEEVAHNYRRMHNFNMWFVVGTESAEDINQVIEKIEHQTSLSVLNTPKLAEFYVKLYLPV